MENKIKQRFVNKLSETKGQEFKGLNWHINFGFLVEKILFARTLSAILRSGINIADALRIIEAQSLGGFKNIIKNIRLNIESGQTLANSLKKYPKYFNLVYIGVVNVGEKSGHLADCLDYVAEQQEKDLELSRKVQSASFYPSIVFVLLLALAALLAFWILPQLIVIFSSFNMPLPWSTKLLLWAADVIRDHGLLILAIIIAVLIFLNIFLRTKLIKPFWQAILMSIPIFGELMIKINLARFCRILGILIKSGIGFNDSINITIESLGNEIYKIQLKKIKEKVLGGLSLGEALQQIGRNDLFPQLVSQMISVGERTGNLEKNLLYLADFYEKEVDNISKNLSSVLEPVLLVLIGFIVVIVGVAIISPIYEFIATLSRSI
ncbi:type II secretion system F family protein [Candidatus Falkowbacteria bacterium]|nr:type II secretion system F family protein [Candidatus Falkowbacteria bacterium]